MSHKWTKYGKTPLVDYTRSDGATVIPDILRGGWCAVSILRARRAKLPSDIRGFKTPEEAMDAADQQWGLEAPWGEDDE